MGIFSSPSDTTITSIVVLLSNNGGERIHFAKRHTSRPCNVQRYEMWYLFSKNPLATFDQPSSLIPTIPEEVSIGRSEIMMSRSVSGL